MQVSTEKNFAIRRYLHRWTEKMQTSLDKC